MLWVYLEYVVGVLVGVLKVTVLWVYWRYAVGTGVLEVFCGCTGWECCVVVLAQWQCCGCPGGVLWMYRECSVGVLEVFCGCTGSVLWVSCVLGILRGCTGGVL